MQRRPATRVLRVAARVARVGTEQADRELLDRVDREFARAARSAGDWLRCAPGCDDCCHGPFPITALDVRRLQLGLAELERTDPGRAGRIRRRAEATVLRLREGYPGDPRTGRLDQDKAALDAFFERHVSMACPALEPGSGRCELYDWRPVSCRTFGPPARFAGVDVAPCELCFRGADSETIERCRTEPDPDGLEQAILAALGRRAETEWETLIAFALVAPPQPAGSDR
jgi:Fe-S-cluster containining protein